MQNAYSCQLHMIHSSLQTMILELMETMIYLVIRVTGLSSEEKLVLKKSFLSNTKTIDQTILNKTYVVSEFILFEV